MARLADLIEEIRLAVPQAPDALILRALRRAAGRFFRETQIWRAWIEPVTTSVGNEVYELDSTEGRVEAIRGLKFDAAPQDVDLVVVHPDDIVAMHPGTGKPRRIALDVGAEQIMVWPKPAQASHVATITIYAVLAPRMDATEIPDAIATEWGPAIINIACERMLSDRPSAPWHNPGEGALQRDLANDAIARAKREQHSGGHAHMRVRLRPRQFA